MDGCIAKPTRRKREDFRNKYDSPAWMGQESRAVRQFLLMHPGACARVQPNAVGAPGFPAETVAGGVEQQLPGSAARRSSGRLYVFRFSVAGAAADQCEPPPGEGPRTAPNREVSDSRNPMTLEAAKAR